MPINRLVAAVLVSTSLLLAPAVSHADKNVSVSLTGGKSFVLKLPQQTNNKLDLNDQQDEMVVVGTVNWQAFKYLSVFGKVMHYSGNSTPGAVWDRNQHKWVDLEGKVKFSGTWVGAGLIANTNRNRLFSTGLGLGYGYLDNPDNILNSTHGQFNITADITANITDSWSVTVGWEHLSNGRQVFKRGGRDSEFYPNNGRDYWTIGGKFRF